MTRCARRVLNPGRKQRVQFCYTLNAVAAVVFGIYLIVHVASVHTLVDGTSPTPLATQYAWSSSCSQPVSSNVYSCIGCRAMHGPPDASLGCGFTCNAALIHMKDQRNPSTDVSRTGDAAAGFSWDVDSSRGVTVEIFEPWRLRGRGSVREVWLVSGGDNIMMWAGNNTGIGTLACVGCHCSAQRTSTHRVRPPNPVQSAASHW